MKKTAVLIFSLTLFLTLVCGCANKEDKNSDEGSFSSSDEIITESDKSTEYPVGTPSLEEIKNKIGSINSYGSIYAFLTGDTDVLASTIWGNIDFTVFSDTNFKSVKVSTYEVVEKVTENKNYLGTFVTDVIFSFTVSESKCDFVPVGDYCYKVGLVWMPYPTCEFESTDLNVNKHAELTKAVNAIVNGGGVSWDKGVPTSYEDRFDRFVFRSIYEVLSEYNSYDAALNDEDVKNGAYKIFGIENYVPDSSYREWRNDAWRLSYSFGGCSSVHDILDIRETGEGKYEVDVQFYADMTHLIPSHKITLYVSENDDPTYKYCFEKSVITERSEYDPYWWSAS